MGPNFPQSHSGRGGPLCRGPALMTQTWAPLEERYCHWEGATVHRGTRRREQNVQDRLCEHERTERCNKAEAVPRSAQGYFFASSMALGSFWNSPHSSSLRGELGKRRGRSVPLELQFKRMSPLVTRPPGKFHLVFPSSPSPCVLCRHHHGASPKRQPRPSQPGSEPTEGEPGALQGLHGVGGSGNMADSPADHQRQRWRPHPRPVAAHSAGTLTQEEVRATWQDDRNSRGISTAPTWAKPSSSPVGPRK